MGKNWFGSKRRRFVIFFLAKTTSFCHFFFSQNDVVLALQYFFLKFRLYQNDVVLDKTAAKRRRFGAASKYPKRRRFGLVTAASKRRRFAAVLFKTTSFWLLFKNNNKKGNDVVLFLQETKRRRFVWLATQNQNPLFFPSSLQQFWGKGRLGGRRESRRSAAARCVGDLTFNGGNSGGW